MSKKKEVAFFNNDKIVKEITIEKDLHNKIIKHCKGKKITHIQINGFNKFSVDSILIKKPKRIKEKIITGNLFKFSNIELSYKSK